MTTIAEESRNDREGSTNAEGGYKIFEDGANLKIDIHFKVRKSGLSGTGKGMIGFEVLDASFNAIVHVSKGLTVGARVPQGENHKTWSKSVTATGPIGQRLKNEGVFAALVVDATSDSDGIPTTPDEFRDTIADWASVVNELNGLADGAAKLVGKWKFLKLVF